MENDFVVGKPVWLLLDDDWQTAEVYENKGGQVTFKTDQDKKYEFPVNTISRQMVAPMHHTSIEGVEDMAKLGDLHEASILFNLRKRYGKNDIYTHIGSILVAVNPYKSIDALYDKDKINSYDNKYLGDLPPHIYAISNEAYYAMWRKGGNQCVLISGESGAGKTESTKHILRFLSQMSINSFLKNPSLQTQSQQSGRVEEVILQSSPILEAFGNSKTIYNNNSSRFGKFIQLHFSNQGNITGGLIIDYLLEKNRVVRQNPGERNFHIFYEICAGISAQQRSVYHLYNAEKYYYLSQSGCISDASLDDQQDYLNVINAMKVIGLTDEQVDNVHHVISSILQLGNINFITTGGAQVQDRNVLENLSNLLQVDLYQLNDALTQKSMTLRGEEILSPLTVEQAVDSRDSVAMALYQACFKWLILKINKKLKGLNDFFSLGVLDIFGFENFQVNRFEQFNINFANEKLQEYFNKHIFSLEQLEYNREGLQWTDIDWNDNGECLDLVEKRLGLLSLIDEESRFPKATDKTLLQKLHENHASNSFYVKPRVADKRFGIRHYAGEVFYEITGFLEKNRDEFREDLLSTLKESRSDFIYDLFDTLKKSQEESNANMKRKKPRKPTVSSQFKDSLFSLMSNLNNANPYFVRCVKPNNSKVKEKFEAEIVLNQLKYSGMLETVKIRKAGFPVRRTYEDFMMRYKCLFYKMKQKMLVDSKDNCIVILTQFDPKRELHRIGNTKIFLKDKLEAEIEIHRNRNLGLASSAIANRIYGYYVRKKYLGKRKGILLIQKIYKGHYYRDKYLKQRNATIVIQKYERRRQAKKLYEELLEQKRIEEERKREEERRRLEEERKEMERLEQQKKMQELEELRQKRDEEERIRKEEEEAKRVKEEMQRQAELARMKELEGQRRAEEERKRLEEERLQQEEIERLQQEEERLKLEEVERLQKVEEDRINQEELERKHLEEQEDALRQMAELDAQLLLEEAMEEEEDFEDDNISMICNEDYSTVEHSAMEGYLSLKGGLMNTARKHWCVLKDDTLMWFRGKQKALKSGWMLKKGGGTGTLSRRNWKRRWFILKDAVLTYHDSDQEGAKTLGTIDLRHCRQIVDSSHKDNALSLITSERTYHFIAESQQDWNDWHSILNRVHRANESELKEMKEESANIRNAVGTIDTIVIESISLDISEEKSKYSNISYATLSSSEQTSYPVMFDSTLPPDRSSSISKKRNTLKSRVLDKPTATLRRKDHSRENSFSIITADRVFTFQAETVDEVTKWVDALDASKSKQLEEGNTVSIEKGWMLKRAPNDQGRDKRRWFILTANSLDYYKSSEKNSLKLGSIILNSLCTVVPPPPHDDPKAKESGQWEFVINGRKRSYNLILPSFEEATKWQMALQEVVNNKPTILTPYDNLIDDIMSENTNESYIGRIYRVNPLLNYTKQPLKMSLLPLPYGYSIAQKAQNKGYGTFHEEALGIFSSLQELDLVADPIAVTQGILQTCHDLKQIRDEVYCQLIKQTTGHDNPNSLTALRHMQVLLCMCCTFLPSRKVLRFLRFHLKRMQQIYLNCEISKFAEFALEALKKTRVREFPPSREEIITLLGRRKLHATVYCYGGGSCQITIDSATTSGEVVKILCKGLKMQQENLIFALFERCGPSNEKSIEDRQIIADVLAKFERYKAMDVNKPKRYKWQLFFKIFCFLHPKNVPEDTVEGTFLFEQTCENVLRGRYQLPELTLCKLAALRLQYWEGDYISGSWIDSEIRTVFPVIKLRKKAAQENKPAPKKDYGTIKGTLRKAISPWKAEEEMSEQPKFNIDEELSAIKSNVMTKWRELQGTEPEIAQIEYMNIIKNWPGFGSTVFNVISKDPSSPTPELAIGVSFNHVAIYRRDETRPLAIYNYEDILSFGAPQPNLYRIIVQGRSPLQFETEKVVEIAKLMKAYINEIVKTARRQSVQLRQSLQMIGDENKHPGYIVEEQTKI